MKVCTTRFGEFEIDERDVIHFEDGMPGFRELRDFTIVSRGDGGKGSGKLEFVWLQSLEKPEIAFIIVDSLQVMPDYNPHIDEEDLRALGEYDPDLLAIYSIVVVPEDVTETRVNLRAPVIINVGTRKARQVVTINDEYDVRHMMFKK